MGLEFKLTDQELPVSPVFIEFLAHRLSGRAVERQIWADQLSESLTSTAADATRTADAVAIVMGSDEGRERLAHAYTLLFSLITGALEPLGELQSRFHFVNFVGIPRTGGSYLTAELYRALGISPECVPNGLAHDSFPEAAPFQLRPGINSWIVSLKTMAEYLTMVEIFFGGRQRHADKIVVPKKLTKAAYAGGLFLRVLGEGAEYVVTVRHPVASCVSTYEKSGGLPVDGRFVVRSNIEDWCRRDSKLANDESVDTNGCGYFDAYLKYWERYYSALASTGLAASRHLRFVAFGRDNLRTCAQGFHDRYRSARSAEAFVVSDKARTRHPEWLERAAPAIERVAAAWRSVGIPFPSEEIESCW